MGDEHVPEHQPHAGVGESQFDNMQDRLEYRKTWWAARGVEAQDPAALPEVLDTGDYSRDYPKVAPAPISTQVIGYPQGSPIMTAPTTTMPTTVLPGTTISGSPVMPSGTVFPQGQVISQGPVVSSGQIINQGINHGFPSGQVISNGQVFHSGGQVISNGQIIHGGTTGQVISSTTPRTTGIPMQGNIISGGFPQGGQIISGGYSGMPIQGGIVHSGAPVMYGGGPVYGGAPVVTGAPQVISGGLPTSTSFGALPTSTSFR